MIRVMIKHLLDNKAFAEKRRITLIELCEETGISKTTMNRLLNSPGYNGSFESIDALCRYFECQPGDLLQYVEG